jgi:hypothetical protein
MFLYGSLSRVFSSHNLLVLVHLPLSFPTCVTLGLGHEDKSHFYSIVLRLDELSRSESAHRTRR